MWDRISGFLGNIFGKKKEEERQQQPLPQRVQPQPSRTTPQPAPRLNTQPEQQAPQRIQMNIPDHDDGFWDSLTRNVNPMADGAVGRFIDSASPVTSSLVSGAKSVGNWGLNKIRGGADATSDVINSYLYQDDINARNERNADLDRQLIAGAKRQRELGNEQRANQAIRATQMGGPQRIEQDILGRDFTTNKEVIDSATALAVLAIMRAAPQVAAFEKLSALSRLGAYGALRGTENVLPNLVGDVLQGDSAAQTTKDAAINFGLGFGLNTVFSPRLAREAAGDAANVVRNLRLQAPQIIEEAKSLAPGIKSINPKIDETIQGTIDSKIGAIEDGIETLNQQTRQVVSSPPIGQAPEQIQGVSRPLQQTQIEDAINSGDYSTARRIVDSLDDSDPYKASMGSMIDTLSPEPQQTARSYAALYNGSAKDGKKSVSEALNRDYGNVLVSEGDQFDLAKRLGKDVKRPNYSEADDFVADYARKNGYDAIEFNNRGRSGAFPEGFQEVYDVGEGKFYSPDRRIAEINATKASVSGGRGAAKTGEIGESSGKFSKGQLYEKTSQEASRSRGALEASRTSFDDFTGSIESKAEVGGVIDAADRDTARALRDRFPVDSAERKALDDIVNSAHTEAAQVMATIDRVIRKTATGDQLSNRFVTKLNRHLDDPAPKGAFDSVIAKNKAFETARDSFNQSVDLFNKDKSSKTAAKKVVESFLEQENANRAAKYQEYLTSKKLLGNSKNEGAQKFVDRLGKESDVSMLDAVDAPLLSPTRTMINNLFNSVSIFLEEMGFGKLGARIGSKLGKQTVGGGSRKGASLGFELGKDIFNANRKLRGQEAGGSILNRIRSIVTTGNSFGDVLNSATAYAGVYDEYATRLAREGMKGDELINTALVQSLTDPLGITEKYANKVLQDTALISTVKNKDKFESEMVSRLANRLGGGRVAKIFSKASMRTLLGFPSVTIRSTLGGAKKALFGAPDVFLGIRQSMLGNPQEAAGLYKSAVKNAGSGAVMWEIGRELGKNGLITGNYPSDKEERERWNREGIQENSIKIAGHWYDLSSPLGVFALPLQSGAIVGRNEAAGESPLNNFSKDMAGVIKNSVPVDGLADLSGMLDNYQKGRSIDSYLSRLGASGARIATPAGGFINQLAKIFDPTVNDTSKGNIIQQFVSKVSSGIPGASNFVENKEVDGNEIQQPDWWARLSGAGSKEQSAGVQRSTEIRQDIDTTVSSLRDAGVLGSDKIKGVLSDDGKSAYDRAISGKPLSEKELETITRDVSRIIGAKNNSVFLEDGDYSSHISALQTKKIILNRDPLATNSQKKDIDIAIKQAEVGRDNEIDPETYKLYLTGKDEDLITKDEFKKLLNSDDPEEFNLAQRMWAIDTLMAESGVSKNTTDRSKNYYSISSSGSGRSSKSSALRRVQGNKVSTSSPFKAMTPLQAPQRITPINPRTVTPIQRQNLPKRRKITVS